MDYILKKYKNSKKIKLYFDKNYTLIASAPYYMPKFLIDNFIKKNTTWINKQKEYIVHKQKIISTTQFLNNLKNTINILGTDYILVGPKMKLPQTKNYILLRSDDPILNKNDIEKWIKIKAKKYFNTTTKILNDKFYQFSYKSISIRNQSSRWGSCSSIGRLNFNWRLLLAPKEIAEYVIIHELAHLKQQNHSPSYWKLVEYADPEYKLHRLWLKQKGKYLFI